MKKKYITPAIESIAIANENNILAGSGGSTGNSISVSEETFDSSCSQLSRPSQSSIWED